MRHTGILSLGLSAALLSPGCSTNVPSSPADQRVSDAKAKVDDAAAATAAAGRAKRDEYARAMSKRLDELNVKYEELKGRAAKAEGQARKDLERKLDEAKVKRDAAAKKLDELKDAGADRWEKIKEGVGSAFDDLKKVFE